MFLNDFWLFHTMWTSQACAARISFLRCWNCFIPVERIFHDRKWTNFSTSPPSVRSAEKFRYFPNFPDFFLNTKTPNVCVEKIQSLATRNVCVDKMQSPATRKVCVDKNRRQAKWTKAGYEMKINIFKNKTFYKV